MKNKIEKSQEYVTKHSFTIESMPLSDVTDISNFINGENAVVMKYTKDTIVTGQKTSKDTFNKQLILNKEKLEKIVAKPENFDEIIKSNEALSTSPILLVLKEYWDFHKSNGLYAQINQMLGKKDETKFNDLREYNVFDNVTEDAFMLIQFVENKNSLRVIMDKDGNYACEPMVFDYIKADLDNRTYDLDEVIEHLMKRDDIAFITNTESSYKERKLLKGPLKGNEDGLEEIIDDIPHYNSENGRDETFTLVYYPKNEDIEKLMNWKMSDEDKNNKVYSLERFVVQDILGCQKFRKDAQPEPPEPEIPKRKFKR